MRKFPGPKHIYICLIIIFLISLPLAGEVILTIEPPELTEGYAQLETEIENALDTAEDSITALLEPYSNKELLLTGFARASRALLVFPRFHRMETVSAGIGIYGSISPVTFRFRELYREAADLRADGDMDAGGGAVPIVFEIAAAVPRVDRLSGNLFGGFFADNPEGFSITSVLAGGGAEYALLPPEPSGGFRFSGVSAGFVFRYQHFRVMYDFPDIDRSISITIDPDGDGPIPGMIGTADIQGTLTGGISSRTAGAFIYGRTGFFFRNALGMNAAVGADIAAASSRIAVSGEGTVSAGGGFSSVEESPGGYELGGSLDSAALPAVLPAAGISLTLRTGPFTVTVPLTFLWTAGFSAGISGRVEL